MAECYLILADRSAPAVAELLASLWRPENTYVLHADRKAPAALHAALAGLAAAFGNVLLVPPQFCSWGGFSLVAVTLAGLEIALARDWTHLLLVSETHLPLRAPEAIRAALPPGRCLLDIAPFAAKPEAAGDLRHRTAYQYREVPGVGSYAAADRAAIDGAWHGSQWMLLSREATILLAGRAVEITRRFGDVLLADEIALQTVLGEAGMGDERRPTLWAATAARGGDKDQILTSAGYFQAQAAENFLFIRKRPSVLPADVAAALAGFSVTEMPALPPAPAPAPKLRDVAEFLVQLRWALAVAHRNVTLAPAPPGRPNTPRCMIEFMLPVPAPRLTLTLLSEDLLHFKLLLLWAETFDGRYETLDFFGLPARLTKARVYGQFQQREIVLGPAVDFGFVKAAWPGDVGPVVAALGPYLAAFARLTKLVLPIKN